ncbi:Gfo/Idh/MocA family oxidoreductase [bacterium]|nr:Gfo/Idh/MocA family oxidoreductase [bacterium]
MGREVAGAMARWCHVLDVDARPELVAVCSRSVSKFQWFKEHFPTVTHAVADYRELVANPSVDAVYCAVPHHLHQDIYCAAINAGKHLLGEKPFGIDRAANAAIIAAAARRPEVIVRCSSEFPFFPAVQRIARMAAAGEFGRIIEVACGFLHSSDLDPAKPVNWKRRIEENGEYGCMGDLGMHVFHMPLRCGWRPVNVRAVLSNIIAERPDGAGGRAACATWDNATLLCEAAGGGHTFPLVARMQRIAPGETNTWYLSVMGTRCSARFSTRNPRMLETMVFEPGQPQAWRQEALGHASVYRTVTGGIFEFGFGDAMLQMLASFCDRVARGSAGDVPFECATVDETRATHDLFTAALVSHAKGTVEKV